MKTFSTLTVKNTETKTNMNVGSKSKEDLMHMIESILSISKNENDDVSIDGIELLADCFLLRESIKSNTVLFENKNSDVFNIDDYQEIFKVLEQYTKFHDVDYQSYVDTYLENKDIDVLESLHIKTNHIINVDLKNNTPARLLSQKISEKIFTETKRKLNEDKKDSE